MKIVLASESIFRKRAMDVLGLSFETRPIVFLREQGVEI